MKQDLARLGRRLGGFGLTGPQASPVRMPMPVGGSHTRMSVYRTDASLLAAAASAGRPSVDSCAAS